MSEEKPGLRVGDVVFVNNRPYSCAKSKVKRIMKRFIELEDGSKWGVNENGWRLHHRYPRETWGTTTMELWDEEKHLIFWLRSQIRDLTASREWWHKLSQDELQQMRGILLASRRRIAAEHKARKAET